MVCVPGRAAVRALLPLVWLVSCGRAPEEANRPPEPGTMRVISVERIGAAGAGLILPNGSFDEWYGGLPAPTGFDAPVNPAVCTLMRDIKSGHLNTTGYTARQTWHDLGLSDSPLEDFRAAVDLAPATAYTLEVVASASPGMRAGIGAWEMNAEGRLRVLRREIVEVEGDVPARYSGTFQTIEGGTVILASHALWGSVLPGSVTWSAWNLKAATSVVAPVSPADNPARRLLVQTALDQVRAQVSLYGGASAWTEGVAPVVRNVARIAGESETRTGSSILGYDQYVFRKDELAYVARADLLARTLASGESAACDAIVEADRALCSRGIQFVVVPVPARIDLYMERLYRPSAQSPSMLRTHALVAERLLRADVLVLDPAPLLRALCAEGKPVYWRGDHDPPSFTLRAIAEQAAPALATLLPPAPEKLKRAYSLSTDTLPLEQRLIPELMPSQRSLVGPEQNTIHSVRDPGGEVYSPSPESPVLAIGSYALAHQIRGASFAAHLSHLLGYPAAVPPRNMSDTEVPNFLRSDAPEWKVVRVVVFCFPDEALVADGWR